VISDREPVEAPESLGRPSQVEYSPEDVSLDLTQVEPRRPTCFVIVFICGPDLCQTLRVLLGEDLIQGSYCLLSFLLQCRNFRWARLLKLLREDL
jgi:hypothetical protein